MFSDLKDAIALIDTLDARCHAGVPADRLTPAGRTCSRSHSGATEQPPPHTA
ncbi:hypothetical protein [Pseudonocardia sp. GCM10023141]|uniref:hypothetical protein n=1 Tax=Pseudonocardia sp. GCM10023141 TaxID=3252653 RepID=UPI00360C52EE